MTIKAPMATPVPCCDEHQFAGWQLGTRATLMNQFVLDAMADPMSGLTPEKMAAIGSRPVPIKGRMAAEIEEERQRERATFEIRREIAAVRREMAELERDKAEAIYRQSRSAQPENRELIINILKKAGRAYIAENGSMAKIRDRRRIK